MHTGLIFNFFATSLPYTYLTLSHTHTHNTLTYQIPPTVTIEYERPNVELYNFEGVFELPGGNVVPLNLDQTLWRVSDYLHPIGFIHFLEILF